MKQVAAAMRIVLAALAVFFAAPAAAFAQATLTMREVSLHAERTLAATSPRRFDMVGLHWRGPGTVDFRTRSLAGTWSAWRRAAPEAEDLPDAESSETQTSRGWQLGNPYWVGPSDRIAYRLRGRVSRLRAYFVESPEERIPLRRVSMTGSPALIARSAWGANEAIRRAPPTYAPTLQLAIVHHTAGTNNYTRAQSAAIVRGIEVYHVQGNGWNDIGYNFLVDKYGQVFEGRYGGVDKNVVGAHAEGFNTGSVGVALLGTYQTVAPTAPEKSALVNLLAWRLDIGHIDPLATLTYVSGGNARFPRGTPVVVHAVSGHRDTGFTTCPGNVVYAMLGTFAGEAAGIGLPKLYAPKVQGQLGGLVRFQARLSAPLPWTVTVADPGGTVVATGGGTSGAIDWTWDASTAAHAGYTWTISAPGVRPAAGSIGTAPVALALKSVSATPSTIAESTRISYTLTAAATVTAVLRAADGHDVATLFTQQHQPGKQAFTFTATGVPEGRYQLVISAANAKASVTATVPIAVDRSLTAFTASPLVTRRDVTFSFTLARAAAVRLSVVQGGKTVAPVYSASLPAGPQTVTWAIAGIRDGSYSAVLNTGVADHALAFRVDTTPPRLRAVSFRSLRFWVSEPATVTLVVNGGRVVRSVRAGVFSFPRRRVRSARISARDVAGNVSRTLRFP